MDKTAIKQACKAAGGVVAVSRKLGLSRGAISQWDRVPARHALKFAALCRVPRSVVRPDLYPSRGAHT